MSFELAAKVKKEADFGHIKFSKRPKDYMKKLLIIGHARHGKDTFAEMLRDEYGYTFASSSVAAAEIFLYEELKEKYGYSNFMECFEDRVNHRAEWHDKIDEYNTPDRARLAKEIMKNNLIYVGMRSDEERIESVRQGVFDLVIGVYDPRKPEESKDSFKINLWEASDIIIPNASTLDALRDKVKILKPLLINA